MDAEALSQHARLNGSFQGVLDVALSRSGSGLPSCVNPDPSGTRR